MSFVGGLVLAVSILLANVVPRAAGGLLILGLLAFLIGNFEDARIWWFLLFGAAWVWLGYALWSGKGGSRSTWASTSDAMARGQP